MLITLDTVLLEYTLLLVDGAFYIVLALWMPLRSPVLYAVAASVLTVLCAICRGMLDLQGLGRFCAFVGYTAVPFLCSGAKPAHRIVVAVTGVTVLFAGEMLVSFLWVATTGTGVGNDGAAAAHPYAVAGIPSARYGVHAGCGSAAAADDVRDGRWQAAGLGTLLRGVSCLSVRPVRAFFLLRVCQPVRPSGVLWCAGGARRDVLRRRRAAVLCDEEL